MERISYFDLPITIFFLSFQSKSGFGFNVMVLNATFNNISVISWRKETGVPWENHRPVASHWQNVSMCCIEYTLPRTGFEITTLVVIGTDCKGIVVNPTTIRSRPRRPPFCNEDQWFSNSNFYQHLGLYLSYYHWPCPLLFFRST